jgi:transcription initiation factor TFIID subunit TAF12
MTFLFVAPGKMGGVQKHVQKQKQKQRQKQKQTQTQTQKQKHQQKQEAAAARIVTHTLHPPTYTYNNVDRHDLHDLHRLVALAGDPHAVTDW